MGLRSLSGRFLVLTLAFVLLAEVLIFLPSVARFRENWLSAAVERAQIAVFAARAAEGRIEPSLERELLEAAGVFNIVLRRENLRELVLSSPVPGHIAATYDLRDVSTPTLIRDALVVMLTRENLVIRVIGGEGARAGTLVEVTLETAPLREAVLAYGVRVVILSGLIALLTAILLFLAVRVLMVEPIRRVIRHMTAYAAAPEDARGMIVPEASVTDLREAEEALRDLQTQLSAALRQKARLAQLGGAVAKVSHDLRNILSTTSLLVDRIGSSDDPAVSRAAPKLVASLSRAITLCETTLAFGRAEEPPPQLNRFALHPLVTDAIENEQIASDPGAVEFLNDVPTSLVVRADSEQLHRVVSNLLRNARQAIEASGAHGVVEIGAGEAEDHWWLRIGDTGPGLPEKARDNLFTAFQGGARKGGFGLGLAIAAELVRGHGGKLELARSDSDGTEFRIILPRTSVLASEPP